MAEKNPAKGSGNLAVWVILFILALALGGGLIYYIRSSGTEEQTAQEPPPATDKVAVAEQKPAPVVDLNEAGKETDQAKEMERRKEELGVKQSLDAVVKEEEKVKVGDKTVSMARIVDQIKAKEKGEEAPAPVEKPEIVEEDLGGAKKKPAQKQVAKQDQKPAAEEGPAPAKTEAAPVVTKNADQEQPQESQVSKPVREITLKEIKEGAAQEPAKYGIHLVKPGDNLWDIHFNFLREYFAKKGIKLAKRADRPGRSGRSSGVARILKYAEKMVFIYSLKDDKLSDNLDLIRPNEKIVVFNISRLDSILRKLDAEKIQRVRLDHGNLTLE